MALKSLHEVTPREQAGARSGAQFDFQYHQAAAASLKLLADADFACVYCEWHDDYVLETVTAAEYHFYQVKTRAKSKGPWSLAGVFGSKSAKGRGSIPPADGDSFFADMFKHVDNFQHRASKIALVAPSGVNDDFQALLDAAHASKDAASLTDVGREMFKKLFTSLQQTFTTLTEHQLFDFLKRFEIESGTGVLDDLAGCCAIIATTIDRLSEVNLSVAQATKIAKALVDLVRTKSHVVLDALPPSPDELRKVKGIGIEDLLRMLSLSVEGYRALKEIGPDALRRVSRLQRLCDRSGIEKTFVPKLCALRADWCAWWRSQQDYVDEADFLAFRGECAQALLARTKGTAGFAALVGDAKALCTKYASMLTTQEPITAVLALGSIVDVAVEAEL